MPHYVSVQLAATLRLRTTLAEFPHSALPFEQWATRWPTSEARPLRLHPRILRPCRSRPPSAAFSCRSRSPSRATRWAALCSRSCPAKKRTRERRAGSIPFKWYAAFDHWARAFPQDPFGSGSGRCLFGAYRMALLPPSTRRCAPDAFMYVNRPLRCNEYNG